MEPKSLRCLKQSLPALRSSGDLRAFSATHRRSAPLLQSGLKSYIMIFCHYSNRLSGQGETMTWVTVIPRLDSPSFPGLTRESPFHDRLSGQGETMTKKENTTMTWVGRGNDSSVRHSLILTRESTFHNRLPCRGTAMTSLTRLSGQALQ